MSMEAVAAIVVVVVVVEEVLLVMSGRGKASSSPSQPPSGSSRENSNNDDCNECCSSSSSSTPCCCDCVCGRNSNNNRWIDRAKRATGESEAREMIITRRPDSYSLDSHSAINDLKRYESRANCSQKGKIEVSLKTGKRTSAHTERIGFFRW